MNGRRATTFAVGALLLLVFAGMVVMVPGGAAAASDPGPLYGVDESQSADDDGVGLASIHSDSTSAEQYELYADLSTYVPSEPRYRVSSRADGDREDDHRSAEPLHRWQCPICHATKISLGAPTGDPDEEAANNLQSHVRNSDGRGHGPLGTLPTEITPEALRKHVTVLEVAE